MRKLPVFVLAAATVLTVAGVPMTAQAATCPTSTSNYTNLSNCFGQSGDINSILSKLGCNTNGNSCSNGTTCTNGSNCTTGSTCTKGASCSGSNCSTGKNSCTTGKNSSSCSKTKAATTNSGRQCKSSYNYWR